MTFVTNRLPFKAPEDEEKNRESTCEPSSRYRFAYVVTAGVLSQLDDIFTEKKAYLCGIPPPHFTPKKLWHEFCNNGSEQWLAMDGYVGL